LKPAFWDSSALVPLCVHQQASLTARRLAKQYGVVVWWCTPVEVRSAVERLLRTGQLSAAEYAGAGKRLEQMTRGWREVSPSDSLRSEAERLLSQFSLRAADAMQLAAAMTWTMGRPQGRIFICGDAALLEAARQLGFQAVEA
jgi:predicted nucleic acid-binding protein